MKCIILPALALLITYQATAQVSKEQKVSNLNTFAKVYGYVRYFHPSEEASNVNWDQFLYYGVKEIENAGNSEILKEKLKSLFNPIAPSVLISGEKEAITFDLRSITPPGSTFNLPVTWQHFGYGVEPGYYKSIRTNRLVTSIDLSSNGTGHLSNDINAIPFQGKKIRLSANLKANVNSEQVKMWLRVDKSDKTMGFLESKPINTSEWASYQIIGMVDKNAKTIVYGAFLKGMGKMWVDNFQLEVEENGSWKPLPIKNGSFEVINQNGPKDWIGGSPGYNYKLVSKDIPEGKNALLIEDNTIYKVEKEIFEEKAKFGETIKKGVGNGLSVTIPLVLMGDKLNTFPVTDSLKLKALNAAIRKAKPDKVSDQDPYVRLAGIIITWNIFQHFYPYHSEVKPDWQAELSKALSAAYKVKTSGEYLELLGLMTEKLKDGHISVRGSNTFKGYNVPLATKFVEGKLVIAQVDSLPGAKGDLKMQPGDILISIDGRPAMEKFNSLRNTISGSEQWKDVRALAQLFNGPRGSEISLKYLSATGKEGKLQMKRNMIRYKVDTTTIKRLRDSVYYINLSAMDMNAIKACLPQLESAKAIICDLRGAPKNNNDFISYLLEVKDDNKWLFVPQITHPDYERVSYDASGWSMEPAKPHLKAKIIFLTGGGAISHTESYMSFIKQYKLGTIVGQPTAGANGDVINFTLPGGYFIRFTGTKVKQQDGSQLHGIGIQPDVFVKETIEGVAEGRDEFIEKALEVIK